MPAGVVEFVGAGPRLGVLRYADGEVQCYGIAYCAAKFFSPELFEQPEYATEPTMTGAPPAKAIGLGCLVGVDGRVYCWGANDRGQLGTGQKDWFDGTFRPVLHVENAIKVRTFEQTHRCALTEEHDLWCWGNNASGEIGNGRVLPVNDCVQTHRKAVEDDSQLAELPWNCPGEYEPVKVLTGVKDFAVGQFYTCAIMLDGTVKCWGTRSALGIGP